MEFEQRLRKAIQRGQRRGDEQKKEAAAEAMSQEEVKSLHSKYQLSLSEKIETCLCQLPNHFPGFQFETVYGQRGWGAAVSRDDMQVDQSGRRSNRYSRLEMTIRPFSNAHVLDLAAKGTVRNREVFTRNHFEKVDEADWDNFAELIDLWVLEFAELYAAQR